MENLAEKLSTVAAIGWHKYSFKHGVTTFLINIIFILKHFILNITVHLTFEPWKTLSDSSLHQI